jgi:hypothetical protein
MDEITYYQGILPPVGTNSSGRSSTRSATQPSSDHLILDALSPLRDELDAALSRGDEETALRLAYAALSDIADLLAAARGDLLQAWQVRIHALLVELKALPLQPDTDGTLKEQGTAVNVMYRNWAIDQSQADAWANTFSQRFRTLWPDTRLVLPTQSSVERATARRPVGARNE